MSKKTYLISYPKSGNTAIRLFLEKYTGLPTSSVYAKRSNDKSILFNKSNTPIITKSHKFKPVKPDDKVIFIVRDYKDSIISYLKYKTGKKYLNVVPLEKTTDQQYNALKNDFKFFLNKYLIILNDYINCNNKKILIRYENFVNDFYTESYRILSFLNVDINNERLAEACPLNAEDKKLIDDWFINNFNKYKENLNLNNTQFIGKYKQYLDDEFIKEIQNIVKNNLGKNHKIYTKVYDVK